MLTALLLLPPVAALAHPGPLDEYGGHFDEQTGTYHYHKPALDMARRKHEYLAWLAFPHQGVFKGVVSRVQRPDALWIRIPYRPVYQELSQYVSPANQDDERAEIRVWFKYASPTESANRGAKYDAWFKERVVYELKRKLTGKEVSVQFEIPPIRRPRGMVFLGEENVNLWLVLNGWSYYVLGDEDNPYHKLFVQAEDLARRDRSGLWKDAR